jgi:hypothetical protein
MNIRKLKKYWHKVLPNTKKIPKRLLRFSMQDKKLAQKYLEGKITLGEYLYQRENITKQTNNKAMRTIIENM